MPKIAQADVNRDTAAVEGNANLTEMARETGERAADAARESARLVRTAAEDTRETARQSAEAAADAGRTVVDILSEQARHNMQAATAMTRAVNWGDVVEVQKDFIDGSFARMSRMGECYRRILQAGATSAPSTFRR